MIPAKLQSCQNVLVQFIANSESVRYELILFVAPMQSIRFGITKAQTAPKQIAPQLEAIALLTFDIVKSMRDDPRDRPSGERFLQRYLPAADHCAEEYAKLVSANNTREDVLQAIAQGEEFFERLHKAFEVELASMLANDSASFSAELNALEKLLRMSGH